MSIDELARILEEKFFESVINYLGDEGGWRDDPMEIHVSDLIYDCMRRAYYGKTMRFGIRYDSILRMAIGKKIHEIPLDGSEHELELEWNGIKGRVDEYIPNPGIVLDKKTCRSLPNSPYDHHVKQVEFYRVLLERSGRKVVACGLIYIDVASPGVRAFVWTPKYPLEVLEKEMIEKKMILEFALTNKILPPRKSGWICKYCDFFSICYGEEAGGEKKCHE